MNENYTQKIRDLYKEVKTYDYNPIYLLQIENKNCAYEIYINDVLVRYDFTPGLSAGEQPVQIPQYILKSGKQSIRYRVYPKPINEKGDLAKTFTGEEYFTIRVEYGDFERDTIGKFHKVLQLAYERKHENMNLPYVEYSSEFEAKVPYELEGWSKSVDLSLEDQKKLEQEVWKKMEEIKSFYQNKNIEELAKIQYRRLKEIDQSFYFSNKKKIGRMDRNLQ